MGKFHDLPWGLIPPSRQALFFAPERPKGGLLGGSGAPPKVSKLQALAAARKKKAEEKKTAEKIGQAEEKLSGLRLGQKEARGKENEKQRAGWPSKRQKVSEPEEPNIPAQQDQEPRPVPADESDANQEEEEVIPVEAAQPSAFAQTLLGSASTPTTPASLQTFALPYAAFPSSVADAFSVPSPDDAVLAAQSKGSLSRQK
jgi:elongation factor 1 alpha-like protein